MTMTRDCLLVALLAVAPALVAAAADDARPPNIVVIFADDK